MRDFGKQKLGKICSDDGPNAWDAPRMIIQLDRAIHLVPELTYWIEGNVYELPHDFRVDKCESLMSHVAEGTMNKKDIEI